MPRWENPTPEQLADTVLARIGESPTFGVVYPYLRPATFTNDVAGVLGEILRARYPDTELSVEALGRRGLLIRAIGRAIVPNLATGSGLPADHSEWEEVDHRVSVGPTGLEQIALRPVIPSTGAVPTLPPLVTTFNYGPPTRKGRRLLRVSYGYTYEGEDQGPDWMAQRAVQLERHGRYLVPGHVPETTFSDRRMQLIRTLHLLHPSRGNDVDRFAVLDALRALQAEGHPVWVTMDDEASAYVVVGGVVDQWGRYSMAKYIVDAKGHTILYASNSTVMTGLPSGADNRVSSELQQREFGYDGDGRRVVERAIGFEEAAAGGGERYDELQRFSHVGVPLKDGTVYEVAQLDECILRVEGVLWPANTMYTFQFRRDVIQALIPTANLHALPYQEVTDIYPDNVSPPFADGQTFTRIFRSGPTSLTALRIPIRVQRDADGSLIGVVDETVGIDTVTVAPWPSTRI